MIRKLSILCLTVVAVLVASCYADKSTFATFDYPDIVVVPSVQGDTLTVAYGETLKISVDVSQEGVSSNDLEYMWEMDVQPGSYRNRAFMGDGNELEFRVLNNPSAIPYVLSLTVTNRESGYSKIKSWTVYVTSSLGEGILVAHTADGGKSSELALVAQSSITYGYTSEVPRYTWNLFSLGNDKSIDGKVTSLLARSYTNLNASVVSNFNESVIMVGTDEHIYALDPVNYKVSRSDEELFNTKNVTEFGTSYLHNVGGYSTISVNGGVPYGCMDLLDISYSRLTYPGSYENAFKPGNIVSVPELQGKVYVYDDELHTVFFCMGWCLTTSSFTPMDVDKMPDPALLADKTCVAAGHLKAMKGGFILKDSAGKYWILIVDVESASPVLQQLDAPDIDKAECFEFCDNADVIFYSVGSKLYSIVVTSGTVTVKSLSWTPSTKGEKVTMLRQYSQAWFGTHQYPTSSSESNSYQFPLKYNRLQLVIVTYDESTGEGRFYLRPYNVTTGLLSAFVDNGVYGGFNEITAICTTMR
ncbi:MAG: hypothetical protein KBT05_06755 [Bacteroidales bacterium]|nr:hypothetical protein [Candidatus Cryptobacteroides caccocaballi]